MFFLINIYSNNKKEIFVVIKINKKIVIIILVFALAISSSIYFSVANVSNANIYSPIVVIDAGHGGIDGGSVSPFSQIDENHINLEYAKTLKSLMENVGIRVVMTRTNLNGLYPIYSANRKKDDMKKRKSIIDKSNADVVISIHMNSFPLSSCFGCQTFYNPNNPSSVLLATNIQNLFKKSLSNARSSAQAGDYFILNCTDKPAVLVECGFLSNEAEEKLLQTEEYRIAICSLILYGVILTISN